MSDGLNYQIWTTVNSGDFKRVTDISKWVLKGSVVDLRFVDMSSGKLKVSLRCPDLDKILVVDPDNHANDVGSTLMLFDNGTWIAALVPTRRRIAFADEKKPWVEYQLEGMEWYLDRARIKAFDNPADPIREGDWLYGAPTILPKAGGELANAIWFMDMDGATTGNYALTDGTDTTSDIAYNETNPATIKTRLETDITAITTVIVSGQGTPTFPFIIQLVDPAATDLTLTETAPAGAAHDGTLTVEQTTAGGTPSPRPWHGSVDGNTGVVIGNYDQFDMVAENTGVVPAKPAGSASTHLLRIDAATPDIMWDYAGAQIEVQIPWGVRHRAALNVYSETAQTVRFVIRTLTEVYIASDEQALSADTWTLLSIPTFTLDEGVETIVYRLGIIEEGNADVVYLDVNEALLAPGTAEAPLGEIATDLLTPIIARSVLGWIVNTWTDSIDSSAAAWDQTLSQGIRKGQSVFHFLEYESRWGYERTLRYDAGNPTSTPFDFGLYNPGNADNNPADTSVSAMDGLIKAAPIEEAAPDFTTAIAEGAEGQWGEYTDAVLATAWGKLEGYFANKQGRDSTNLDVLAQQMVADSATETVTHSATVQNPSNVFGINFILGDTLPVAVHAADGSITAKDLRLVGCTIKETDTLPIYGYSFGAIVFDPEAAQADAMRSLIRRFNALDQFGAGGQTLDPVVTGVRKATAVGVSSGAYIHLSRAASQTIAVNGEAVSWDTQAITAAGFTAPTLPVIAVSIFKDGYYNVAVEFGWTDWTAGGTVEIVRSRGGADTVVWPLAEDPELWSTTEGQYFSGVAPAVLCRNGDTIQVKVDHDDSSTHGLATATLGLYLVDRALEACNYPQTVLDDSPLAYWRLGETSGTNAADETGTYDGTYNGSISLGVAGGIVGDVDTAVAVTEAATGDFVDIGDIAAMEFSGTSPFSLEAWVRIDETLSAWRVIIQKTGFAPTPTGKWLLGANTSGSSVQFRCLRQDGAGDDAATTPASYELGVWYHLVATYDGTDITVYVNGAVAATQASSRSLADSTGDVRIGRGEGSGVGATIDEVAPYNTALTPAQVLKHYTCGIGGVA